MLYPFCKVYYTDTNHRNKILILTNKNDTKLVLVYRKESCKKTKQYTKSLINKNIYLLTVIKKFTPKKLKQIF